MSICLRCIVNGKVQGVFYRSSTQARARTSKVTGWVRNCDDGSVELLACGDQENVNDLCEWLWEGPGHANVTAVQCYNEPYSEYDDFSVIS